MLNTLKHFFFGKTDDSMYIITQSPFGRFVITGRSGNLIASYARKRDAIRGAARRGLTLAN